MRRIVLAAVIAACFFSCDDLIKRAVVLTFNDAADSVTIAASTTLGNAKEGTREARQIADEREALLAGHDAWSVRFANADPETDRVTLQRTHGELQSLEHIASIAPENLQKFFFDTPITITFTRGDGWAELAIYPGTSDRATRHQREDVERMLDLYSNRAARYFETIRGFYAYLNEKPRRAEDMFYALFRHEDDPPARVSDDEQKLVNGISDAMDALADNPDSATLDRDFDAVFNPFPADLKIAVQGNILALEGFARLPDRVVEVKTPTAIEAVSMLEGRWITPDPLAVVLNGTGNKTAGDIAASLAAAPRRSEPVVTPSDISAALMEKMRPAARYRVRWLIRPAAVPSPPPAPRPGSSADERTSP
jgi:hypothetical protein